MKKRSESFLHLKELIGFAPRNLALYEMALRHSSLSFTGKNNELINNERLEFLGDAVLNSIVAEVLYHRHSEEDEGFLSAARAAIVNREQLNQICLDLNLDKLLKVDKHIDLKNSENILGNALEAVIGAVYLDRGYNKCREFVKNKIMSHVVLSEAADTPGSNYKSQLLEWCQLHAIPLHFELISEEVDEQNRHHFVSQAIINNVAACSGSGNTKKESHQQASRLSLKRINEESHFADRLKQKAKE